MGWTIYDAEGRPLIVQQDHDEVTIAADAAHSLSAQELAAVIAATGQTGHMSGALWDKLDGIEAGADITDAANVDAAGAVLEADFNAATFLYATSDDTPQPKTRAEVMALLSGQATAAFAMNSKKITGLAAGSASGEAVEFDQIQQDGTINYVIDGGGSEITTGVKGFLVVDFAATIESVTMLADQSGSIIVDIWMDIYGNYPPTNADSITSSAVPTISGAIKSQDSTLTGWTTAIPAGSILGFNVDSAATIERLTLALKISRD